MHLTPIEYRLLALLGRVAVRVLEEEELELRADVDLVPPRGRALDLAPQDLARQPLAGSLLALRPGVTGLPESRFGA